MNGLQKDLPECHYTRDMSDVECLFRASNVDLREIIVKRIRARRGCSSRNPFTLVDLGCGSGTAIEEYAQMLISEDYICDEHLRTVGVDKSLVTHLIPARILNRSRKYYPDRVKANGFLTEFIECDLEQRVPLDANSVDVLYALELVNYITDSLRFLENVYRCLLPDGVAVIRTAPWAIAEPESLESKSADYPFTHPYKTFTSIAARNIPGAESIFEVVYDEQCSGGVIIMRKMPWADSISFGCRVHRVVSGAELGLGDERAVVKHVRSAVYRTLKDEEIQIAGGNDIPVCYLVNCPL